ncbi:centrosomal protein 20-like [Megaptera novaeangliae]
MGRKEVLKDTLEKRGVLGHLKARIRAEVFNALDDESEPRPSLSHENLLINELIREYLEFNKYKYTASVLIAGCNLCFKTVWCLGDMPHQRKEIMKRILEERMDSLFVVLELSIR